MRVVTIGPSCRLRGRLLDNHSLIYCRRRLLDYRLLDHRLLNDWNRLYDWLNNSWLSRNDNCSPWG